VERLLIGECLSQALLAVAKEQEIQVDHVTVPGRRA
jgi:hypothetical protein